MIRQLSVWERGAPLQSGTRAGGRSALSGEAHLDFCLGWPHICQATCSQSGNQIIVPIYLAVVESANIYNHTRVGGNRGRGRGADRPHRRARGHGPGECCGGPSESGPLDTQPWQAHSPQADLWLTASERRDGCAGEEKPAVSYRDQRVQAGPIGQSWPTGIWLMPYFFKPF